MKTDTNEYVIDVRGIGMNFGRFPALSDLNLQVRRGSAMALLGENGAGKTTTLRILTNIYRASSGSGSVLGYPLGSDDSSLFQKLGYVSENQRLPLRWTLQGLIDYLRPQYPTWDETFCEELIENFELPRHRQLGQMSRGMQMKASLISSLAYRPELLLLDEPFSGLDPLVREELIDGILELMDGGNWTLLLSSHDIHEVERLCDAVTVIENGSVVLSEPLDTLQTRFRKWSVQLSTACERNDFPADWLLVEQHDPTRWSFVETLHDPSAPLARIQGFFGPLSAHESQSLSLREIYLVLAKDKKQRRHARKTPLTA
jgi:ABC-2 type transport system ATP-binding protein